MRCSPPVRMNRSGSGAKASEYPEGAVDYSVLGRLGDHAIGLNTDHADSYLMVKLPADGKYFVHTDGPDGKMNDFEVRYTFGVDPLQLRTTDHDRYLRLSAAAAGMAERRQLAEIVARQAREIERLDRRVALLMERAAEAEAAAGGAAPLADQKPPHW